MTFHSILFENPNQSQPEALEIPAFFTDLNLDQIIDAVTMGRQEYNLKPFFYAPLHDVRAVLYRHEIMHEIENPAVSALVASFAQQMHRMRERLTQMGKLYYKYQQERWFLDAVAIYCDAVRSLEQALASVDLVSRGLIAFRDYMTTYTHSEVFTSLLAETQQIITDLSAIKYSLIIEGNCVHVRKYEGESDYSAEVEATFEKFKQGAVKDYRAKFRTSSDMNHVEAQILDMLAQLYPDLFAQLDHYCLKNSSYLDETIAGFDREVQFYLAYLEFIGRVKRTLGLKFCYPQVSGDDKEVFDNEGFDLALANKLMGEKTSIVCNDFYLKGKERIIVVSGPNQGGKTTFARTFGQLHYLASLGCLVPGREAKLFLFDRLFTHFEREEDITNLRGKLQDDLMRIYAILNQATPNSIIIMNEIFTSTTLEDAVFLSKKVLERIIQLDSLCICVTFIDELATLSEKTISMVSTIVPENPAVRTYKVIRKPADGLAHALSIAEKYRLTYDCLKERIPS